MSIGKHVIVACSSGRHCGHPHCGVCRTKRGRRLGNRKVRHAVRTRLRVAR